MTLTRTGACSDSLVRRARLAGLLGGVGLCCACSPNPAPSAPSVPAKAALSVTWPVDNLSSIGGYTLRAVGQPRLIDEPAGRAVCFEGLADALVFPVNPLDGQYDFTIQVLLRPAAGGESQQQFLHLQDDLENRVIVETRGTADGWFLHSFTRTGKERRDLEAPDAVHPFAEWHWAALTYSAGEVRHYVDGRQESAGPMALQSMTFGQMSLGARLTAEHWFKGCVRELRFANGAIPAEELARTAEAGGP